MVTVDIVWTENTSVGAEYDLISPQGSKTTMNLCTSIKFWSYLGFLKRSGDKRRSGDVSMNYELVSSMAAPHGRGGEICALAVNPYGNVACTLSQEEDAFRVWVKNVVSPTADVVSTLWKCNYKVKTPSGFSNLLSNKSMKSSSKHLVTFSSDGTVLAVSYGPDVTLWDHSNATLLTSVRLGGFANIARPNENIDQVHFLTKNDDTIFLSNGTQIGVKSPFGGGINPCYLGGDEWSFDVNGCRKEAYISAVAPLHGFKRAQGDSGFFAVSVTSDHGTTSIISIISRVEGKVVCEEGTDRPVQWRIDGEVQSLCLEKCHNSFVQLLATTNDYRMLSLSCGVERHVTIDHSTLRLGNEVLSDEYAEAPVLKMVSETVNAKTSLKRRKVSFGGVSQGQQNARQSTCFEFPALSGKFTSAFIAKNLGKGNIS